MSPKGKSSVSYIATRSLVSGFSVLALMWAFFVIPVFWRQSPIENVAKHIIAEAPFNLESLILIKAKYADLKGFQENRTSVLSAAAIINLRLLEEAVTRSDKKDLDFLMNETDGMIRRSLVNAPADSFLWTVLFWLENTQNGFNRDHLEYLRMSYLIGPNEGWIGVKRNRFALAIFPALTSNLAENAISEFAHLVESNYFAAAADILEGPGWPIHEILMSGLRDVDDTSLQTFAKIIYRRGLDLSIPGVDRSEWRPWH